MANILICKVKHGQ